MKASCLSFVWGWWYSLHGKDLKKDSAIQQIFYWSSMSSSSSAQRSSSELQAKQDSMTFTPSGAIRQYKMVEKTCWQRIS